MFYISRYYELFQYTTPQHTTLNRTGHTGTETDNRIIKK